MVVGKIVRKMENLQLQEFSTIDYGADLRKTLEAASIKIRGE